MALNRRNFLKLSGLSFGGLYYASQDAPFLDDSFPQAERLGRVNVGKAERKLRPDINSPTLDVLYMDAVVPWRREVVGVTNYNWINQRWVETDEGYIYCSYLQPVRNRVNEALTSFPVEGEINGMWAEVSVPWVDIIIDNPPARAQWFKESERPRLYYSQIVWVDQIKTDSHGQTWYRVNERYGNPGDILWVYAEALRPIMPEEITPIQSEAEEKRVVVNVSDQTMACFEGQREVHFCRISTGYKIKGEWETPLGKHPIWRKLISLHMSWGTTGVGWDIPGVGWTTLFVGEGFAIHSTYWHNDFGAPRSHGCVNAKPEDAKWVFRWVEPTISYEPGDLTVPMPGGTLVEVIEN